MKKHAPQPNNVYYSIIEFRCISAEMPNDAHFFPLVARERFELSSEAPEAPMLDHYTTGLQPTPKHASLL